jgi:hypothetical protein
MRPRLETSINDARCDVEMRVEVNVLESGTEPGVSVQHQSALMMALRTGSLEVGSRRSEMMRFTFGADARLFFRWARYTRQRC